MQALPLSNKQSDPLISHSALMRKHGHDSDSSVLLRWSPHRNINVAQLSTSFDHDITPTTINHHQITNVKIPAKVLAAEVLDEVIVLREGNSKLTICPNCSRPRSRRCHLMISFTSPQEQHCGGKWVSSGPDRRERCSHDHHGYIVPF